MAVQYHTIRASLAAEDDQLLRERLADALVAARLNASAATAAPRGQADSVASSGGELVVRVLERACGTHHALQALPHAPAADCSGQHADSGPVFRTLRTADGDEWRIVSAPLPALAEERQTRRWVEVSLNRSRDEHVLDRFRVQSAAVLGAALCLASALGYGLARQGLQPLRRLSARVAAIDVRSLGLRLCDTGAPAEVAALSASFDTMLTTLQAAFDTLSTRSAELAHEIRTPVHVLRQQAEVALRRTRTADEYREVLSTSLEELDRLRRLIDDLLFLARAADPRALVQLETLSAAKECADVAEFLEALADERNVELVVDAPREITLAADQALLRRALVNLVTNALRHTPAGGRIALRATRLPSTGDVAVFVDDSGTGIKAALQPQAFELYVRGDGGGAGLGLAIVRGIMDLHRGTARIESIPAGGTRVTLTFPS